MRKHSKVILLAEEQLVFGHSLPEMVAARDNLRSVVPESCCSICWTRGSRGKEWNPDRL
jgi:hypothetical protein